MTVVGVTGRYCSGKDTVTQILVESGFTEIDVDKLGHLALESQKRRVIDRFGSEILLESGAIDRKALGAIVFADSSALRDLEAILHPEMVAAVETQIENRNETSRGFVINAAILIRMGLDRLCDTVLYVTASFLTRFRRARQRDHAGLIAVIRRLAAQRDVQPQHSASNADIQRVENDGSREQLRTKLRGLNLLP